MTAPKGDKAREKSRAFSMSPAETRTIEARCVRLKTKAENAAALAPTVERHTLTRGPNDLLIEVKAAAVNPSDVKAATGLMPYAVFPRTPQMPPKLRVFLDFLVETFSRRAPDLARMAREVRGDGRVPADEIDMTF